MRARAHRRSRPSRTAAAPTYCRTSVVVVGAGARGATTSAPTRLRRCPPGQNRRDGCAAQASRNRRRDGRTRASCSRLPASDLGAPGRRRADRRKGTTGTPARTDTVSFVPHEKEEGKKKKHKAGYMEAFFNMEAPRTHCSGARRASVAVWGSLKERPSFPKGRWVSPTCSSMSMEQRGGSDASPLRKRNKGRADQDRGEGLGDSHRFRHHWANNRMALK